MAKSSLLRVMISSRCLVDFDGRQLSEIRKELKQEIEALTLFNRRVFEVWINEDAPPKEGSSDSWEVCLQAVRDCDILIVLANGSAGWAKEGGGIGLCHAEMMEGLRSAPGKVRVIDLDPVPIDESTEEGRRNKLFQEYVKKRGIFHGRGVAETADQLKELVREALHAAIISLAQEGVWGLSTNTPYIGAALDWNRLDFEAREEIMTSVLKDAILERRDKKESGRDLIISLGGERVLLIPHAIPAALSIGPAKEMVGQPFLEDYEYNNELMRNQCGGPVHIIACYKNATELQAIKILGFPDATVITAPFGVFVADNIQKVQFAFITNCRDEASTRHGMQRFFDWLEQSGEEDYVARRARARAAIVRVIAENISPQVPKAPKRTKPAETVISSPYNIA